MRETSNHRVIFYLDRLIVYAFYSLLKRCTEPKGNPEDTKATPEFVWDVPMF